MFEEDIKSAPARKVGAYTETSCGSITSAERFQQSSDVPDEPANDVVVGQELEGPGVEVCEACVLASDANGFFRKADGSLWKAGENGKEAVCISEDYIKVVGLSRTLESDEWRMRIEFKDLDGNIQSIDVDCSVPFDNKEILKALRNRGFYIPAKYQRHVLNYLQSAIPDRRIRKIDKTGWINGCEYICPSFKVIRSDNDEQYELPKTAQGWGYDQEGTLEDWQEHVAKYCIGNHILTLSLCIGLSGLLLRLFPQIGTTVVNLIGKTSLGKTTALKVAASLWGGQKYVKQWRATDNSLESIAEAHNDGLLILDDLGQADSKKVGEIAYMLGNQRGKGRCNANSSLKRIKSWSLSVLSSGEVSLEDKLNEAGLKAKGGHKVRFIDIDAIVSDECGIYNNLHGLNSGAELSNHLKEQASKYYGIVSERFVNWLIEQDGLVDRLNSLYRQAKEKLINKFCLSAADGEVLRVVDVFTLYATAGDLAVSFGLFPTKLNVEEAIGFVFERWLKDRGGKRNVDEEEIIQHIMGWLGQCQSSFLNVAKKADNSGKLEASMTNYSPNKLYGYVHKTDNETRTYYIFLRIFKEEACKGYGEKTVKKALHKKGILTLGSDGYSPKTKMA
ncbi:MAG: DUF927 domain-containing protein [Holosporales bacterium]|jgi:putative DNA primase/helicase|nr:DUF927 domain-containing protein [Holosporales bacterium]